MERPERNLLYLGISTNFGGFWLNFVDDGKILSVINVGREGQEPVKTVVIQEIKIFKTGPVREMMFLGGSPPQLLVASDTNLKLMNVRQCFTAKIKSCR